LLGRGNSCECPTYQLYRSDKELPRACQYHSFLLSAVPKVLAITRSTKPKDVQAAVQQFYKQRIGYQAAHKVLQALQKKDIGLERDEFRKIPAYLEVLKKEDPSGHFILKTDSVTERFQRLFISPSACRNTFRSCPRIVACDGTFTKSKFRQTLLFAVTIDGNDELLF
jgi:hypothetical protein